MKRIFLQVCGAMLLLSGYAQQASDVDDYRPKIAEFSIESLMEYKTTSSSETYGTATNEIEREQLIKANLGIPVLLRDDMMFGVMLKYNEQRFVFDMKEYGADYDLYEHLDSRKFTCAGARFFYKKDLTAGNSLMMVGGAELKSDEWTWTDQTTKYFLSGGITHQLASGAKIGGGLMVSRTIGRTLAFPLFTYEKRFSPKWTVDLALPKSLTIRHRVNDFNYLIGILEVKGYQYNMTNSIEGDQKDLTLRKTDLQLAFSWEHELHDWLWMSADVGYNKNLKYCVTKPGDASRDAIIDLTSKNAPYLKVSLFIVPPRKFFQ